MADAEPMTVQVRVFAGLQHLVGGKQVALTVPANATVATLRDRLVEQYPVLDGFMSTYVIAVGEEVQPPEHRIHDGDLVDLIPPISGG